MKHEELSKRMGHVIAKAWSDEDFKAKLIAEPVETLKAEGIEISDGLKVNVVENTKEQFYLAVPDKSNELSDETLDGVSGGFGSDKKGCMACPQCNKIFTFDLRDLLTSGSITCSWCSYKHVPRQTG